MGALIPGTPEHDAVVSASKVAGILGLSIWSSPRATWHRMRGDLPGDDGRNMKAKARGHYLEPGCLAWWRDQHEGLGNYAEQVQGELRSFNRVVWAVATPDAKAVDEFGNVCIVDAKTVNDEHAGHWGRPGTDEVPAYYYASTLWQFACHPDAQVAYLVALFGSPRFAFEEYVIERRDDEVADLIDVCWSFYQSLKGDPPPLDDSTATYDAIRKLHPDIDREASVDLTPDEAAGFVTATTGLDAAKAADRYARSLVLDRMGKARTAWHDGRLIARRQPHPSGGVSLVAVAKSTQPKEEA